MKQLLILLGICLLFISCEQLEYDNLYAKYDPANPDTLLIKHNNGNYYESPNGEEVFVYFTHTDTTFHLEFTTTDIEIDYFFFDAYDFKDVEDQIENVIKHTKHSVVVDGVQFMQRDTYELSITDSNEL